MSKKTLYKKIALYSVFLIVACVLLFVLGWRPEFDDGNTFVDNAAIKKYEFERLTAIRRGYNSFYIIETVNGDRYYMRIDGLDELEREEMARVLDEAIEDRRAMRFQIAKGKFYSKPYFSALEIVDLSDEFGSYVSVEAKNDVNRKVRIACIGIDIFALLVYLMFAGIQISDYRLSQKKKENPEKYLYGKELEAYRERQRRKRKQSMQKKMQGHKHSHAFMRV